MRKTLRCLSTFGISILVLFVVSSRLVFADSGDSRTDHRIGAYIGFLGDPFPTLVGVNLAYNVTSFARLVGGYGSISTTTSTGKLSATTAGGGLRLFVPRWSLSPVVGISYARVSVKESGVSSGQTVGGFGSSASHVYASFGIDWQAHIGFDFGLGYNLSFMSGVGGLPFINIGWFF